VQISLNNQVEEFPTGDIRFFGQLMEQVLEKAATEGSSVLSVELNGEDVTGRDRANLQEFPVEDIERLEITTGDPKHLARSTLYSIADFQGQLLNELQNTTELFRLDNTVRSNEAFLRCLDGLQIFMHTLESCRKLLGLSFELLIIPSSASGGERTVAESRRQIFAALDAMIEAQTDHDWILLADIMQYELIPSLEEWRGIIQVLLEKSSVDAEIDLQPEQVSTQPATVE
jgi:hypothetical protein